MHQIMILCMLLFYTFCLSIRPFLRLFDRPTNKKKKKKTNYDKNTLQTLTHDAVSFYCFFYSLVFFPPRTFVRSVRAAPIVSQVKLVLN